MALTYDTKLRIPAVALSTTAVDAAANFTCGANAEVLVVMICYAGTTQRTGGSPTYNGVALTQVESLAGVTEASCEMWYMLAPPTGAALSVDVQNDNGVTMWIYVASGNAAAGSSCVLDDTGITETTSANPSVSVTTSVNGCLIFACVTTGDNSFAPSARTGTSLYEEDIAGYGSAAQYYVMAGNGAQAMSWTEATSDDHGALAVAFKEVITPITISLDTAAITAGGQSLTVVEGAVTKSLDTALVTASGPTLTVLAPLPSVTVNLDTATITAAGQSLTLIKGAVSVGLLVGNITASGPLLTLIMGAVSVILDNGIITAAGPQITVTAPLGGLVISLDTATITASGQALTVVEGGVSIPLDAGQITASGQSLTVVKGGVSIGLDCATITAAGPQASIVIVGGATVINLDCATITATALAMVLSLIPRPKGYGNIFKRDKSTVAKQGSGIVKIRGSGRVTPHGFIRIKVHKR